MENLADNRWWLAFLEFFVVVAFGIGWLILEWQCRRLDRRLEEEKRTKAALESNATETSTAS